MKLHSIVHRRWAYEQVAEALCRLYKDVTGRVGQHLLYGSARPGCPGALADALLALAQGLSTAKLGMRLVAVVLLLAIGLSLLECVNSIL